MPTYDAIAFRPPAPLAHVVVRSLDTKAKVDGIPMLIDTGAAISLLPRHAIASLLSDQQSSEEVELQAFDGTTSFAQVVMLEVEFLGRVFRGPFALTDDGNGILGRNILNAVRLLLDGPALIWAELR